MNQGASLTRGSHQSTLSGRLTSTSTMRPPVKRIVTVSKVSQGIVKYKFAKRGTQGQTPIIL